MTTLPFIPSATQRMQLTRIVLENLRVGRRNAIRGKDLALKAGLTDDRLIRAVIRELIADGKPIASSVTEPMGYYVVADGNEAAEYIKVLESRIREDAQRLTEFKIAVATMDVPEQRGLF